jgi:hypothetical protein
MASGFVKFAFKSEIAAWRSAGLKELISCSEEGVAEGAGVADGEGGGGLAGEAAGTGESVAEGLGGALGTGDSRASYSPRTAARG